MRGTFEKAAKIRLPRILFGRRRRPRSNRLQQLLRLARNRLNQPSQANSLSRNLSGPGAASPLPHPDQPMQPVGVALELLARAVEHDAAAVHHGGARRDVEREPDLGYTGDDYAARTVDRN